MMKLNLKIKQTSELDEQDLNSLIDLKQQYWNYSTVEQKNGLRRISRLMITTS